MKESARGAAGSDAIDRPKGGRRDNSTACVFFRRGWCRNGDDCAFSHGISSKDARPGRDVKGLDELADLLHRAHLEQPRAKECLDVAAATPNAAPAMGVRALVNVPRARARQLSSRTK